MDDYYGILELTPHASNGEIKRQYHLLVHAWHPDKFPEGLRDKVHEKIARINAAYAVLGNPARRADYDRKWQAYSRAPGSKSAAENDARSSRAAQDQHDKEQHRALRKQHQIDRLEHRILTLYIDVNRLRAEYPRLKAPSWAFLIYTLGMAGLITIQSITAAAVDIYKMIALALFVAVSAALIIQHNHNKQRYRSEVEPKILGKSQEIQRLQKERELLIGNTQ